MLTKCTESNLEESYKVLQHLWQLGYSAEDIITNIFRFNPLHLCVVPMYINIDSAHNLAR